MPTKAEAPAIAVNPGHFGAKGVRLTRRTEASGEDSRDASPRLFDAVRDLSSSGGGYEVTTDLIASSTLENGMVRWDHAQATGAGHRAVRRLSDDPARPRVASSGSSSDTGERSS